MIPATSIAEAAPPAQVDQLLEYAQRMTEAERIAHFGVWRWDLMTGTVRWSDELHRIYGLMPGEFAGTLEGFVSFLHPDDRDRVQVAVERAIELHEPFVFEERIIRSDGEERVLLSQGRPIIGAGGSAVALVGVCQDVTDRAETRRALGHSERRMRAIIDHSPSIVAVKDLAGRYVMSNVETARVLGLRPEDMIGRECTEFFPTVAEQLRANDRRALAEMEPVYDEAVLDLDGELRTYLTITFALPDEDGRPAETCTIATDITERKEREAERRERLEWAHRIRRALAEERMLVYAQPVVQVETGAQASVEFLVRMREGVRQEVLAPAAFLPAAERFGLIQEIDLWMVRQALRVTASVAPAVNLSAISLCDPAVRQEIISLLTEAPEAARRIVFEITETASLDHLDAACEFAKRVTELGCGLALDDFGTGFGSFTYLRRLPLRYLKIDRSFVHGLVDSRDDQRVVQSIIGIGRQFGLSVIAEGVESEDALELLRGFGVDYAQGFHLGAPAEFRFG
jgi:PAS domain S-box-containing protein